MRQACVCCWCGAMLGLEFHLRHVPGRAGALRQACPGLLCGKRLGRLSLLQVSFEQPQVLTGVGNKSEASVPSDHPEIAVAPVLQDILAVIRKSSAQFDNVCMATAMHKMGTIMSEQHMQPEDMALIARKPEFEHLKSMIGEPAADCSLNAWASWPVQIFNTLSAIMTFAVQADDRRLACA